VDDIIKIISEKKFIGEKWIKNNYPDFHLFIFNQFSEEITWKAKFYLYKNGIGEVPRCHCGNLTEYKGGLYREYCSVKCSSSSNKTKDKIKKTNIKKYGYDIPLKNSEVRKKSISKCLINWGVDNPSKSILIKDKVKKTNKDRYGVDYHSQLESVKEKLSHKMKMSRKKIESSKNKSISNNISNKIEDFNISLIELLGKSIYKFKCHVCNDYFQLHKNTLNDRIRNKNTICSKCNPISKGDSDGERKLYEFIRDNYSGEIIKNDRSTIKKELDIFLPELGIAFEYNGLHWHSELYKENNYHQKKSNICRERGIKLINIWEDDWLFKSNIVKSRILNILNKSERIWARKCKIVEISDTKTYKNFLEINHIQGFVWSKIKLGLIYNNELISIMTFGNLRKNTSQKSEMNNWELLRYSNKLGITVVGGASKLLKYFTEKFNTDRIISYADRDWSDGNLYDKLGFKKVCETAPNYHYIIGGSRKNRFSWRKDILVKMGYDKNKTEREIMFELKYFRIYNTGNIKYELILK